MAQAQVPPEGKDLDNIAYSWQIALADLPTHHLEECFIRAIKAKRDNYPLATPEVNTQWDELQMEIKRKGVQNELDLLMAGRKAQGSARLMTFSEWKAQHNVETCANCQERIQMGQPPITIYDSFAQMVGKMPEYDKKEEADALLEEMRWAMGQRMTEEDIPF